MKKYIIIITILLGILTALIIVNNNLVSTLNTSDNTDYKDKDSLEDNKKELEMIIEASKKKIEELENEIKSLDETLTNNQNKIGELEG